MLWRLVSASIPAMSTSGLPVARNPIGTMVLSASPPMIASITARWSIAAMMARRSFTLLVGAVTWLGRSWLMKPHLSSRPVTTFGARCSIGSRSGIGISSQSTSPVISALAAVAGSGIIFHSTRSTSTRCPPEVKLAG